MTGIVGAMDIEIEGLKKSVSNPVKTTVAGIEFVCGKIEECEVCVAMCNPGKVNAALCTQLMIDRFSPECIINVGVACSLSKDIAVKDVVIASEVCQYDMDTTAVGDEKGLICGLETVKIKTDEKISSSLFDIAKACGYNVHSGCVASGDTFIASQQLKDSITGDFGAVCGEMEGGSIGHVCAVNGVPFAVLRSISDGGDSDAQVDYPTFKNIAAEISSGIMHEFFKTKERA